MIQSLGDVTHYPADTVPFTNRIMLSPDFSWINNSNFSAEIVSLLTNLKNNHATSTQNYISFNTADDISIPTFRNEKSYSDQHYPNLALRLLAVFRYWNVIQYWYPYKGLIKNNWDKNLDIFLIRIGGASDENSYLREICRMIRSVQDTHAVVRSAGVEKIKGKWQMPLHVVMIGKEAIIDDVDLQSVKNTALKVGDIVKKINGIPVADLIKNKSVFIRHSAGHFKVHGVETIRIHRIK